MINLSEFTTILALVWFCLDEKEIWSDREEEDDSDIDESSETPPDLQKNTTADIS